MGAPRPDLLPDPYETLGVGATASRSEIRRAYRRLVLVHHPDRVPPSERTRAEERIKRINAAASVLLDPVGRARFDDRRARPGAAAPGATHAANPGGWPFATPNVAEPRADAEPIHPAHAAQPWLARLAQLPGGQAVSLAAVAGFMLLVRHLTAPSPEIVRRELEPVPASAETGAATASPARPSPSRRLTAPRSAWRAFHGSTDERVGWREARDRAERRTRARRPALPEQTSPPAASATGHAGIRWPMIEQAMRQIEANHNGRGEGDAAEGAPPPADRP